MSKVFYISLGVIFAAPAIAQVAIGGYMGYMFSSVQSEINKPAKKATFNGVDEVQNAKKGGYFKRGFIYLKKLEDVNAGRTIRYSVPAKLRDFVKRGEPLPAKDMQAIFVEAKAHDLGREYCEQLKRFFAKECLVRRVRASEYRDSRPSNPQYNLYYELAFVQKEEFGNLNTSQHVAYDEIDFELDKKVSKSALTLKGARKIRNKMLHDILKQCRELKRLQGNCAITNVVMGNPLRNNRKKIYTLRANTTFSYLKGGPVGALAKK